MKAQIIYIIAGQIWISSWVITEKWFCLVLGVVLAVLGGLLEVIDNHSKSTK